MEKKGLTVVIMVVLVGIMAFSTVTISEWPPGWQDLPDGLILTYTGLIVMEIQVMKRSFLDSKQVIPALLCMVSQTQMVLEMMTAGS